MATSDSSSPAVDTELALAPQSSPSRQVTLQVGERRFITTEQTLATESGFFEALLSARWDSDAQEDGSFFIDADPALFSHILGYLRRGVLPVFFDTVRGHDYAMYVALLEEARYFHIPRLEKWLGENKYLNVVKISTSVDVVEGVQAAETTADEHVEFRPTWQTRKVYLCPRRITCHRGNPFGCGRQCMNARGDDDVEYDDEKYLVTAVVRKRVVFNSTACTADADT
jgi:hypothetical protein